MNRIKLQFYLSLQQYIEELSLTKAKENPAQQFREVGLGSVGKKPF